MLFDQRAVSKAQPVNQDQDRWAFFGFDDIFFFWEAYAVAVQELIFTMIAGVVAVTAISFLTIPHWSGAVFVFPMIVVLYLNLLGTLQAFGLYINGLTYICVVVSIGLLVDFLIHILLSYYESLQASPHFTRDEHVKETLNSMGVSVLIGGVTTFLGILPATISTAKIFSDFCYSFVAITLLGLSHGLILLPVLLSLFGPTGRKCSDQDEDKIGEDRPECALEPTIAPSGSMNTWATSFGND